MAELRRSVPWIGAAGVAAAALVVTALAVGAEKQQTGTAEQFDPHGPPLAGGRQVTLAEATTDFVVPFYRPDLPLASDESIRDIWMSRGPDALLYTRYRSGITLKVGPPAGRLSTEAWAEALTEDGVDGDAEDVGGLDAFVVNPDYPSLGSVRFFFRNVYVVIIGDGPEFTTSQLRDLAISTIYQADVVETERAAAA